ncbi:MAG: flagellar motor switch protein FliM [Lachnospiraceae bacterium]|nr:flagellar motor switch protein FliM [Lachnospiraceae bacterium]
MSEVLSQSQIDALLNSMKGGGDDSAGNSQEKEEKKEVQYRKYDFYSPRKFTTEKLKLLRNIFENYSRIATSQMNSMFRMTSDMEVQDVEEQRYSEFNNALTDSDIMTLVKVTLPEQTKNLPMLMHISPRLMVNMIDRMMGGPGDDDSIDSGYVYTSIENVLYQKVMSYLVNALRDAWSGYIRMDTELERVEQDPSMFQDISVDETVAIIVLSVQMGKLTGNITICIPGNLLTDIFNIIDRRKNMNLDEDQKDANVRETIMNSIRESALRVNAQLGVVEVSLQDLYNLHVGDVIDLNKPKESEVSLFVEDQPWFTGKLGVHKKNMAIKIENRIADEEDEEELRRLIPDKEEILEEMETEVI